jgi:hypothetical protein
MQQLLLEIHSTVLPSKAELFLHGKKGTGLLLACEERYKTEPRKEGEDIAITCLRKGRKSR